MEDIDRLIIRSLKKLNWLALPSSLEELGTKDVIEGIVRGLWAIDPRTMDTLPSFVLPPSTTGRFRLASSICSSMKAAGVDGTEPFGYQNFLYPSVYDVRRIFIALLDKLPKEDILVNRLDLRPIDQLREEVNGILQDQLNQPLWTPGFCRYLRMRYSGRYWHPSEEQAEDFSFTLPTLGKPRDNRAIICSLLNEAASHKEECALSSGEATINFSLARPRIAPKPKIGRKGAEPTENESSQTEVGSSSEEERNEEDLGANVDILDERCRLITVLKNTYDAKRKQFLEVQHTSMKHEQLAQQLEEELGKRDRRLEKFLLKPNDEGLEQLQRVVDDASSRQLQLQDHFIEAKSSREVKLREKRLLARRDDRLDLAQMRKMLDHLESSMGDKSRVKAKLRKRLALLGDEDTATVGRNERAKYVRGIMEIMANVSKQNEEILKTTKSVRKMENEVTNYLSGTLARSFTAVERWLKEDAGGDTRMQKAYKLLARIHEHCNLITEEVKQIGQLNRQINYINNEIEIEAQKAVDAQMDQLLIDLLGLKHENSEISKRLRSLL